MPVRPPDMRRVCGGPYSPAAGAVVRDPQPCLRCAKRRS
jgi:hypothetical protein